MGKIENKKRVETNFKEKQNGKVILAHYQSYWKSSPGPHGVETYRRIHSKIMC